MSFITFIQVLALSISWIAGINLEQESGKSVQSAPSNMDTIGSIEYRLAILRVARYSAAGNFVQQEESTVYCIRYVDSRQGLESAWYQCIQSFCGLGYINVKYVDCHDDKTMVSVTRYTNCR